ncbi:hypothetical protein I7X30_14115 [Capnocytophaga sp. 051621]|jgi:hypothetical protein|uniref:Type I restriction enzyme R protein N-terminal domain-containing protein n=2 Tax=Capnocytophaga TaxID=1016 RepID=A0ABS1YWL6_9FLAO|nr:MULTISPECIES: hypothetical protein [Capnocytophaga]MBI1648184.1 hypothetical protein [Capnocytophaga periodontitidis]MBM0650800.1 hypothetical protein [Capnocytophaga genosp. AHN8471]MBM0662871.1 hypothetical protein [Capnocytophaga genosp. AHN8471]
MSDSIRTKEEMFDSLIKIIKSKRFKRKLAKLNDNFFNLKQEIQIRNLLVELFNRDFKGEERAIAEYRVPNKKASNKNIRIDLALVNTNKKALIELKYLFPNDPQIEKESLKNYFSEREECNYLIAIICNGNKHIREAYEHYWGIETIFSGRYSEDSQWKELLEKQFKSLKSESNYLEPIEITVENPFKTTYHFFILERK